MTLAFLGFSLVFILLALIILIRQRQGKPLTKLEKAVLIIGLVAGITDIIAAILYISLTLLPDYPWFDIIAQIPIGLIFMVFSVVFIASITTKIVLHYKKPLSVKINELP